MFHGKREEAERVAKLDFDHGSLKYNVDRILFYRGNPDIRTTMEFMVYFADGEESCSRPCSTRLSADPSRRCFRSSIPSKKPSAAYQPH
jgi:hypothetical protein